MASVPTNSFQRRLQHYNNINRTSKKEEETEALILNIIDGETGEDREIEALIGISDKWRNFVWAEIAIGDKRCIARFRESAEEILSLYGNSALLVGRTARVKYSDGLSNIYIVGLLNSKTLVNPNKVNFIYDIGV
jgi:hypothetical protein